MATCIIQLDNFQGQYYPGNSIIGKVICSFPKPINIRGIRVMLEGKEHTQWTQKVSHYDKDLLKTEIKSVPFSGSNHVLNLVVTLTGEGSYPAGRHEYPFTFSLPKNLPATYQGKHGWIKYNIMGIVVIPFGFDHKDIKEFKVVAPIDFNEIPGFRMEPVTYSAEKNVWCLFRSCGLVTMKIHLEKAAFVQGEVVKIKLEVSNMSTENVQKVETKIRMVIESKSTFPSKESKFDYEELAVTSDTGVGAHGERTYIFDMIVPDLIVVPNFPDCKLFHQSATIDVAAVLKGFHSNMAISVPIQLGNIPVRREEHFRQSSYSPSRQTPPYTPIGEAFSQYPTNTSQPQITPRDQPPPYSQIDPYQRGSPSHIYPGIPPSLSTSGTYSSSPQSNVPPKAPPEPSVSPSAPPKEDLDSDDEFVLV